MKIIDRRQVLTGLAAAAAAPIIPAIIPSSPARTVGHWVDYGSIDLAELGPFQLFFRGMPVFFDDECPPDTIYMFNADAPVEERTAIMSPATAEILWSERDADFVRLKL